MISSRRTLADVQDAADARGDAVAPDGEQGRAGKALLHHDGSFEHRIMLTINSHLHMRIFLGGLKSLFVQLLDENPSWNLGMGINERRYCGDCMTCFHGNPKRRLSKHQVHYWHDVDVEQ